MSLVPTSFEATSSSSAELLEGRIVGVVGDIKEGTLRSDPAPVVFTDTSHVTFGRMTLFVRAERTEGLPSAVTQVIRGLDPNLPTAPIWLADAFATSVARERMNAMVLGAFAATALLLAACGLYGLLTYVVADRTREIGIRMALGARAPEVVLSVVSQGLWLVIPGVLLGLAGALAVARGLETLLYGVAPYDPATFAPVVGLLLAIAVAAIWGPARRATRVDPLIALREEQRD